MGETDLIYVLDEFNLSILDEQYINYSVQVFCHPKIPMLKPKTLGLRYYPR